ncbi:MAG: DnaJ domain-containing protein [Bradymonadaceae bacterium]
MTDAPRLDDSAVPERRPGVDIDSVSESPSSDEFFIYSRIDGDCSVGELSVSTGLGRERTETALQGLVDLGLIEVPGMEPQRSGSDSSAADSDSSSSDTDGGADDEGIDLSHLPTPPDEYDLDEQLLEIDAPLDERHRRELACLHAQLDDIDHYEFFGVASSAPRGEIKRAYFEYSKRFHPDKFFRRELGPFEEMLEDVFQRVTRAHRVLSDPDKREEYDEELSDRADEAATPMSQPSSVEIARESGDEISESQQKRSAAFAKLVGLAEEARKKGDHVEAAEHYRKALRVKRDIRPAIRAAKALLRAGEQLDQAELFAKAALRIDDEHLDAHLCYARILEEMGEEDRAVEAYDRVLELDGDHDRARERRARLRE